MYNTEEKNNNIPQHKPVRNFTKHKVYDRAKDRKDKKLYEVDDEDGINEEKYDIL